MVMEEGEEYYLERWVRECKKNSELKRQIKNLKEQLGFRLYGVVFGDERAVQEIEIILDDLFDKLNKR